MHPPDREGEITKGQFRLSEIFMAGVSVMTTTMFVANVAMQVGMYVVSSLLSGISLAGWLSSFPSVRNQGIKILS